jgi:hypothetical protein
VVSIHSPVPTDAPPAPGSSSPRSLPRTGTDGAGLLLRLADLGFVAGVALVAVTGVRRKSTTAGH